MTNRGVRATISHLSQIRNDVGRGRVRKFFEILLFKIRKFLEFLKMKNFSRFFQAWIRLALNDGSMESYIACISNESALVQ